MRLASSRHAYREDGMAILVTMIVMLVVSLLGATLVTLGQIDYDISAFYRSRTSARHLADSGLEATFADIKSDYLDDPRNNWSQAWLNMESSPPSPLSPFPDPEGSEINGVTLTELSLSPNPYPGTPYAMGGPVGLGNGSYRRIIWLPPSVTPSPSGGNAYQIGIRTRSIGSEGGPATPASVTIDAVIAIEVSGSSPYDSGLFIGHGESGQLMSGERVRVAGSVHAVGAPGVRFRFRRSYQVNHYTGIENIDSGFGPLAIKIPTPGTTEFNGEVVSTLHATFRMKEGNAQLQAGGMLGEADVSGDGIKETLNAVHSDAKINPMPRVHADVVAAYDMDEDLSFPSLSDPYTDPDTGAYYATYSSWLDSHAYRPPLGGDLIIDSDTESFSYVDPSGRGYISWDAAAEMLTIDGVIKVDGQVKMGKTGPSGGDLLTAIKYQGTGAIYATDKIEIHKDLYPSGQFLADGPDADALIDGNLGLIAGTDMQILTGAGQTSNLKIMATLFAERKIEIKEPANIAGALVTNFLDVRGADFVNLWHVPRAGSIYPLGMPTGGMTPGISGFVRDWFENR
jgi:hypothetical protein